MPDSTLVTNKTAGNLGLGSARKVSPKDLLQDPGGNPRPLTPPRGVFNNNGAGVQPLQHQDSPQQAGPSTSNRLLRSPSQTSVQTPCPTTRPPSQDSPPLTSLASLHLLNPPVNPSSPPSLSSTPTTARDPAPSTPPETLPPPALPLPVRASVPLAPFLPWPIRSSCRSSHSTTPPSTPTKPDLLASTPTSSTLTTTSPSLPLLSTRLPTMTMSRQRPTHPLSHLRASARP